MKMKRNFSTMVLIYMVLLSIILTGCNKHRHIGDTEEILWDYKPMISIDNLLYGDTGYIEEKLPNDSLMIGEIEKEVTQTEPMVKDKPYYISNTLPVETKIYGIDKDIDIIYAEFNSIFIRYELSKDVLKLTLDEVVELSKRKDDLSWDDFKEYNHDDIGSGLYIYNYPIDDNSVLLIGGKSLDEKPEYIYLEKSGGRKMDVRKDNVEEFVKDN